MGEDRDSKELFNTLPEARESLLFAFERETERTIWVWIFQAFALSLLISFSSLGSPIIALLFLFYSGALLLYATRPRVPIYNSLAASFTKEEKEKVYERAAGVKETLRTVPYIILLTALFLTLSVLIGRAK